MSGKPLERPGTQEPGTLAALRHATASRHAEVDALLGLRDDFAGRYPLLLQGLDAYLPAWETRLADLLPDRLQAWFAGGRHAGLVRQDLAALKLPRLPAGSAPLPQLDGLAQALGSLYVIEGSALGGQLLAAQARRELGLDAQHGAAYLHGCGADTARRWRQFQQLLATELDTRPATTADAVLGAQRTFDTFRATFEPLVHAALAA